MLTDNAAAVSANTRLLELSKTYTALAGQSNQTVAQVQDTAVAFTQLSDQAKANGLAVQAVGNALVFTVGKMAEATPAQVAYANSMTDANRGSVDFVTVNGKVTATLQSIADIARNDTIPAIQDVTVTAAQAGVSIGQGGQAALQAGENFDVSGVKVTNFKEATQAVNTTLQGLQTAANNADQGVLALSGDAGHFYTLTQVGTSTIITFTDGLNNEATALGKVASAAKAAAGSIASLDSAMQAENSLQSNLEGTGVAGGTQSLAQLSSIFNPFNNATGGPEGVQSNFAPGTNSAFGINESPLQQYQDQMSQQAAALIQQGYTIQSIALAISQAESTYSSTIDTSVLVQKSATTATTASTAATTAATTATTALASATTTAAAAQATSVQAITGFTLTLTKTAANQAQDSADASTAYGALDDALNTALLSYADLSTAQQQSIEQNLQSAAAGGMTATALTALATQLVTATQSTTTLASSTTAAATAIAAAGTTVSNAAVAVAAAAVAVVQGVSGSNALATGITSSQALSLGALTLTPGVSGTNGQVNPDGSPILGPGGTAANPQAGALTLNVNMNGGMMVGNNGMQQFTQMMMPLVVSALRQAGAKV